MRNEETEGQRQGTAGYITIPMVVLDGWVGHDERYLKWWTWLRREAGWTEKTVWFNRQQVYLHPSETGYRNGQFAGKAVGCQQADSDKVLATIGARQTY